jgi:hypothetical protein
VLLAFCRLPRREGFILTIQGNSHLGYALNDGRGGECQAAKSDLPESAACRTILG